MPKPNRLSHFLPLAFRNGQSISRFAKHCVRCNELVTADHMHGVAAVIQNRIVIAAKARCPACDAEFAISCVITEDKKVHRVLLPGWMLRWWLSTARTEVPRTRSRDWQYEEEAQRAPEPPRSPSIDRDSATLSPEALGQFDGEPIPAWISVDGTTLHFVRTAPKGIHEPLRPGEVLFNDRLIYSAAQRPA